MEHRFLGLAVLLFSSILLTSTFVSARAAPFTQQDNEAKEEIFSSLANIVNNSYSQYRNITAGLHNGSLVTIYNQSEASLPPPPSCPPNSIFNETSQQCEPIPPLPPTCPADTVFNETSQQCEPIPPLPPTCPTGQHFNQTTGQCQDDVTIPPPPPPPIPSEDKPNPNFNTTSYVRVATFADIDNNNGLVTQLNLAKKYHAQVLIVAGDYGYNSCTGVIDKIKAAGFTKANAVIVQGNHDCSSNTKAFNGYSQLYGSSTFANGKLEVFAIDGNRGLSCSDTQFKEMKPKIESSDAWYNFAAIHQPFVTAKSDHGANGQFACWDPVFRANGVNAVLEGHNHNYQRFDINGLLYWLVGTGTHDTGSKMYPIESDNWNGFKCLKCIDDTNGIGIMDLAIGDPNMRHMHGWFLSNSDAVKDSFHR